MLRELRVDEYFAGNTLHIYLIIICAFLLLIKYPRFKDSKKDLAIYFICFISGYLFFCMYLKWHPFNSRLHLPLFVLASPFIALILTRLVNKHVVNTLIIIMFLQSLIYIYYNGYNRLYRENNILNSERTLQYFNYNKKIKRMHENVVNKIIKNKDKVIGFKLYRHNMEYPLWVMIKNLDKNIKIYHVDVKNHSSKLYNRNIKFDSLVKYDYEGNYIVNYIDR